MQVNTVGVTELADLLEQSKVLDIADYGSTRMYVLEFDRQDILVFADPNSDSFVVYPPESFDHECGGSIHEHARAYLEGGKHG